MNQVLQNINFALPMLRSCLVGLGRSFAGIQFVIRKTPIISSNRHYARHFSVLILSILLTACATLPDFRQYLPLKAAVDPLATWQARSRKLADLKEWSATGRLAIRTDTEAWNVGMHWRQQGDDYRIRFNAPLALGAAEIVGTPQEVTLRTTKRQTFSAANPEQLLFDTMGWRIPVSGLQNWILGRPEANLAIDKLYIDKAGRLKRLIQSGWEIRCLGYERVGEFELPIRLELKNARFSTRIQISRWILPPS